PAAAPSDDRLLASVSHTLVTHVLPALPDGWARQAAIGLVSVAVYGRGRPPDPNPGRTIALAAALNCPSEPEPDHVNIQRRCSRVLTDAVTGDSSDPAVHQQVRSLLVHYLDEDIVTSAPLYAGFRGQLPDGQLPPPAS